MQQLLFDYDFAQGTMAVHCNNTSAIDSSKNLVLHSCTKHIDIWHHFIQDLVMSQVVSLTFVPIDHQLADILTKPLDVGRFEFLRKALVFVTCLKHVSSHARDRLSCVFQFHLIP
jgi:hypothetical protein